MRLAKSGQPCEKLSKRRASHEPPLVRTGEGFLNQVEEMKHILCLPLSFQHIVELITKLKCVRPELRASGAVHMRRERGWKRATAFSVKRDAHFFWKVRACPVQQGL